MIDVYALNTHFFSALGKNARVQTLLRPLLREQGLPENAKIIKNAYGKPILKDYDNPHFNGSHSGHWLVCALGQTPMGIDVQRLDFTKNTEAIAKRFMTEKEVDFLASLKVEEAQRAFYTLWAQKESYMKYTGLGFTLPLKDFEVRKIQDADEIWQKNQRVEGVFLKSLELEPGYTLWICSKDKEVRLIERRPETLAIRGEEG